MNSLQFLYVVYGISIVLLVVSILVSVGFVIPLQIGQMGIKNGLVLLRRQLLTKRALGIIGSIIAILSLLSRFIFGNTDFARYVVVSLVFVFSLRDLVDSCIDSWIYHTQYTEKSIEFHRQVSDLENKEEKLSGKE